VITEFDWTWQPNSARFRPSYFIHAQEYGKASHAFRSPYWMFEYVLPPKKEADRRDIMVLLSCLEGKHVLNVHDPRVPYPSAYHDMIKCGSPLSIIPELRVTGTNKATSSITVVGISGDTILKDDPIAFTHDGVRHYYRAKVDLKLNGAAQSLDVYLRPRIVLTGVDVVADRIKPTNRFLIDINQVDDLTSSDGLTSFTLTGIEFHGVIT